MNDIATAYFDGGCSGNPGPMTIKWIALDRNGNETKRYVKAMGGGTNKQAEYMALLSLLQYLDESSVDDQVLICGASKLVTNQIKGAWCCFSH